VLLAKARKIVGKAFILQEHFQSIYFLISTVPRDKEKNLQVKVYLRNRRIERKSESNLMW